MDDFELLLLHLYPNLLTDQSPDCDLSSRYYLVNKECYRKFEEYFSNITQLKNYR